MTDAQVVEYVKSATAAGKSQEQISRELLARGVSREQAERIRTNFEAKQTSEENVTSQALSHGAIDRDSRAEAMQVGDGAMDELAAEAADPDRGGSGRRIFGHSIFNGRSLSFEPNENAATPQDYRLGPGDQLIIEIWGYSEGSYTQTITPEGRIYISQIGPIQLSGLTIEAASEKIRKALVSKYASIGGSKPNTSVSVTLGQIRTIQVNVMGEVQTPGTYRLSSFSTVFHAIYRAGGVSARGSLRAIRVIRGGEEIAKVDVYEYLMEGKSETDITLQEGDIIMVPPYVNIATVGGNVKRPMSYELLGGETLATLFEYAGGFTSEAYVDDFRLIREKGPEHRIFTIKASEASAFRIEDGDYVSVGSNLDRYSNRIEIRGYVFRPGMYELGKDIATVRQLIAGAGGLKEDAFTGRAVLVREKDDLGLETLSFDLAALLAGKREDILLRKNDIVVISGIYELQDRGTLTINGLVASPGVFPYSENTTIEDLILQAGGLLESASLSRVDVARRVSDPYGMSPRDTVGQTFSFSLENGLIEKEGERFVLQPYDVVSVRRSPTYGRQHFVRIDGEVAFPGTYVLLREGERLSELIQRAGGPTNQAFLRGASLTRQTSDEERAVQRAKRRMNETRDSLVTDILGASYFVGIELDKAVQRPGSEYDIILRAGDRIYVPEHQNTIRVSGNVLYPNAVTYVPGKSVDYYVAAAGGYGFHAKRSKTYIVYQNGNVRRTGVFSSRVEPGCEIIVPTRPERKGLSTGDIISLGSSTASLGLMVATLINTLRK
jgi:protein involved in polysaccharide export with SLBB domain